MACFELETYPESWTELARQADKNRFPGQIWVETYIPVGFVGDVTPFIREAITAAGPFGVLEFPPNRTLMASGTLKPLERQIWHGNGCVIKNTDAIATTTTDEWTTTGSKTITVADPSGFVVGTGVVIYTGTPGSLTFDTRQIEVSVINGNQITLDLLPSDVSLTGGGVKQVQSSVRQLRIEVPGVKIYDLTIDGNRINNSAGLVRWEMQNSISGSTTSSELNIRNCRIINSVSEGAIFGGRNAKIMGSYFLDIGGNAVHGSGAIKPQVSGCIFERGNLYGVNSGHADGFISSSNDNRNWIISGNSFDTTTLSGVGGLENISSDSDIQVFGNTFIDCDLGPVSLQSTDGVEPNWVQFNNNIVDHCGPLVINSGGTNVYDAITGNALHQFNGNTFKGALRVAVNAGGANHEVGDVISFGSGGSGDLTCRATVVTAGAVVSATVISYGAGYTDGVTLTQFGTTGSGTGLTVDTVANPHALLFNFGNLKDSQIHGNTFDLRGIIDVTEAMTLTNAVRVDVKANKFLGGLNHIRVAKGGSPSGVVTYVTIQENEFYNPVGDCLFTTGAANVARERIIIKGNNYVAGLSTANNSEFMTVSDRTTFKNNDILCNATQDRALNVSGDGVVVSGNTIIGNDQANIRILAGSTALVKNNEGSLDLGAGSIVDDQSGGSAVVRDNDLILA